MQVSDITEGQGHQARIISGWVEVIRHGNSGTVVQPVERVTRTVKSKKTGETKTFTAPQDPYVISAATPVYELRRG